MNIFAELRPILSSVNVTLTFSSHLLQNTFKLEIEADRLSVISDEGKFITHLEGLNLDPLTCRGLSLSNESELQFTIQSKTSSQDTKIQKVDDWLGYLTNQDAMVTKILNCQRHCSCVACGTQILKPNGSFRRVLPLPSESWSDFADFWFCHNHSHEADAASGNSCSQGTEEPHKDHPTTAIQKSVLSPKPGDCLVSNLYMLIVDSQVADESVRRLRNKLVCKQCGYFIGTTVDEKQQNTGPSTEQHQVYQIFFHAVSFEMGENDPAASPVINSLPKSQVKNHSCIQKQMERYISSLLADQSRMYTCFRFIVDSSLHDENEKPVEVLIWMVDQNVSLYSTGDKLHSTSKSVVVTPQQCTKLLYKIRFCQGKNNNGHSESSVIFQAWKKDNTVHPISLPYPFCKQLIAIMISSTKRLPKSQRSLNGFHVGFLNKS